MADNRRRRLAWLYVAIAIGAVVTIIGLRLVTGRPQGQQDEKTASGPSTGPEQGAPLPADGLDTAQSSGPPSVGSSSEAKPTITGLDPEQQELSRPKGVAEAAGVNPVPLEQAKMAALRFAVRRWDGARVGPTRLVYAPDGVPEAHFCVILKRGTPEIPMTALSERISALGRQRVQLRRRSAEAEPAEVDELATRIRSLSDKMRGSDKYATVVVGANDGREPFVASFDGLPPQIILRNDAIEMQREQLGGADPGEPSVVWLPPLFVAFEFPPADGHGAGTYLQARGTELHEVDLHKWQRVPPSEKLLQQRRAKWQRFRAARDE